MTNKDQTEDTVVRSMTDDGSFRAVALRSDNTVTEALSATQLGEQAAELYAQFITGAVLVRETMSPQYRMQLSLYARDGLGHFDADAFPSGDTRGRVVAAEDGSAFQLGPGSNLRLSRTLHGGQLHEGIVALPEGGGVSDVLMAYMQGSEQVFTVLQVGVRIEAERVVAGGYLVQLLPEYKKPVLALMIDRLEAFSSLDELLIKDTSPDTMIERLLAGLPSTRLAEAQFRYACNCSRERLEEVLLRVAREEIELALEEDRTLETRCEFCGSEYELAPADGKRLLSSSET